MNDQRAAIIAKLKALIEARKASVRIRIVDKAFATLAALLLLCSTAQAAPFRQVSPPARPSCRPTTIIVVPVYRAPRPVIYYGTGWYPMGR